MKNIIYSDQDQLKIQYAKNVILNEGLKLVTLFILFSVFGVIDLFLTSLMSLVILRIFTGGIHHPSQFGCWLISAVFFSASILLSYFYSFTFMSPAYIVAFSISIITIAWLAPIESPYRPMKVASNRLKFKVIALAVFIITWIFLHYIPMTNQSYQVGLFTLLFQCLQMLIAKAIMVYKEVIS